MVHWAALEKGQQDLLAGHGHGIATGARSAPEGQRLIVIDEDRIGAWIVWLTEQGETVEPTLTVKTPRPGTHYFYLLPAEVPCPSTVSELAPGVDTRGEGGYAVCPGSPHVNGGTYVVHEDRTPAPAPAALIRWLTSRGEVKADTTPGLQVGVTGRPDEETTKGLVQALKAAWPPTGTRHVTQRALAGALVHGGYDPEWIVEVLTSIGGDPEKRQRTVDATVGTYEAGGAVEGWPTLRDRLSPGGADEACKVLSQWARGQMAELRAMADTAITKPTPTQTHEYTYAFDHVPDGDPKEKKKVTPAELAWVLQVSERWDGVFRWDSRNEAVVAYRPPVKLDCENGPFTVSDAFRIQTWLDCVWNRLAGIKEIQTAVRAVAQGRPFDPLVNYLDALPPGDGRAIAEAFQALTIEADEYEPIFPILWRKFLISAIVRAYRPGCKVDSGLVLKGEPAVGKSTLGKVLFGESYYRTFAWGDDATMTRKARGAWVVEFAELQGFQKADLNALKAWMTTTHDSHVAKYEESAREVPRGFVVVGTTNETEFLRDSTGERRWWVLPLSAIDLEWFERNRDRIWADARDAYKAGEAWYLATPEERKAQDLAARRFSERDVIEDATEQYIKGKEFVDPTDVACHVLSRAGAPKAKPGDLKRDDRRRVIAVLRQLGCKGVRVQNKRMWQVPKGLS